MSQSIGNIQRLVPGLIEQLTPSRGETKPADTRTDENFGDLLSNFIGGVNKLHNDSADIQQAFLDGEPVELHQVMVKAEEAGIATELLIEIRNKLVDAYSELIRMPV
jgi:flagellar hook-basal body complex protein FliE